MTAQIDLTDIIYKANASAFGLKITASNPNVLMQRLTKIRRKENLVDDLAIVKCALAADTIFIFKRKI